MPKLCPDCGSSLGINAYKCRCGWNAAMVSKAASVDCFFAPGCTHPAQLRTDDYSTPGKMMALCPVCEDRLHLAKALSFCKEKGLDTTDKKIAYCREMFAKVVSRIGKIEREAGQDDEERIAA